VIESTPTEATYTAPRLYLDGEWLGVDDRRTHRVLNPATGEALAELPLAGASDLDRALDAAERGFKRWRQTDPNKRAAVLAGAARLLRERADAIARNATLEEGKTLAEAVAETHAAAGLLDFYAGEAVRIYGRVLMRAPGKRTIVTKEPVGPVAAFSPWNFPIHNPVRKLGALSTLAATFLAGFFIGCELGAGSEIGANGVVDIEGPGAGIQVLGRSVVVLPLE